MVRGLRLYIYLVIVLFPVATYLLGVLNESNGIIWLGLETSYYYPVYLIAAPLFKKIEMGLLVPTMGGRFLAFLLYPVLLILFFKIKDKCNTPN
jgi:hypothetical protein